MKGLSKAAKAAAITMHMFTEDMDLAVKVFDALAKSTGPIDKWLDKFGLQRYGAYEDMDGAEYWECIEMLAHEIDKAVAYFEEKKMT